ncbi:MAG: efflux RND transporter permease subunit, partial [Bacteroidia bacterium]|nr:efflux RND transporter permease subunit [Bacteroidia bacterium]
MNLVELSMKYRQVSFTIMFILLAVGIYALLTMPRSEDPEVKSNQALVVAFYPGASAEVVEEHVTRKIEDYLFTFKEIRRSKTYTTSEKGRVVVNLELIANFPSEDRETFWNKLQRGLNTLQMPQGVIGPILNSEFGETVALMLAISSKRHSYAELEDYLDKMRDGLKTIPDVARIQSYGVQQERITINLDSKKMARYQVGLNQIAQSLQQQNQVQNSGDINAGGADIPLFTEGLYATEDQIAEQIVDYRPDGSTVRLKDIASIARGYQDPEQFIKAGESKVLMLAVEMQPGKNIVKFGEALEEKIAEIQAAHFPSDIGVEQIYSQPHAVDHAISHFMKEFAIAIVAVIMIVMMLLPFRMATISAIASPVSIFITLAILNVLGIGLHSVSLAGMIVVLGMVVDDAIIIVDNYIEKLDEGMRPWEAAWKSATQLFIPVLTATLTIIFAFLPMNLMLKGIMGDYIETMPYTVAIALTTSFMVAIFITPYLCYLFIKKGLHHPKPDDKKPRRSFLDRIQSGYDRLVELAFKHKFVTMGFGVLAIIGGFLAMGQVAQEFSPKLERTVFNLEVWMPEGTTVEQTEKVVDAVVARIEDDERIENISSFIGTSSPRFFVTYAPEPP